MAGPKLRFLIQTQEATAAGTCREEVVQEFPALVGRGEGAQLVLDDPSVCPTHMVFEYSDGTLTMVTQKDCPVVCNQRPVAPDSPLPIEEGDEIRVGVFVLVFAGELPSSSAATDGPRQARAMAQRLLDDFARSGQWLLCMKNGPSAGRCLSLGEGSRVRLGRASDCHLVMDDHQVSRVHALMGCSAGQVWLEDAGSANGVLLNGRPIEGRVPVPPGAHLGLGRISLLLEQGPPSSADLRAAFGAREKSTRTPWWSWLMVCLVFSALAVAVGGGG